MTTYSSFCNSKILSFGLHIKPSTLIPLKKSKDLSLNTSVGCIPYHIVKDLLL